MQLDDKVAVVYGGGGAMGGAAAGVRAPPGRVDICFNAAGMDAVQNVALVEMSVDDYLVPIVESARRQINTATGAAKRMIAQGSGAIIMLSSTAAREWRHEMGGFNVACTGIEALTRSLSAWYADMLGVDPPPADYGQPSWRQEAGVTVFAAFPPEMSSEHLAGGSWGLNLRVTDLDAMVAQLRAGGNEVTVDPELYPNGRFAATTDPEGNSVQLWEPAGAETG